MVPDDLSRSSLLSALDGAKIVYFDVRLHETALLVAEEVKMSLVALMLHILHSCVELALSSRLFKSQTSLFPTQIETSKETQHFSSFSFWLVISVTS